MMQTEVKSDIPQSILGRMLPCSRDHERGILISFKSYFDGSHQGPSWKNCDLIALAGFAAGDAVMASFERDYDIVLHDDRRRPSADYLHMKELRSNSGRSPFSDAKGWNNERRTRLVSDVVDLLGSQDKARSHLFLCSVEPRSLDRLRVKGANLPSPLRICTHYCPHWVMAWHAREYPGIMADSHYYFDFDEPFKADFEKIRKMQMSNRFETSGNRKTWELVKSITNAYMKETPALQVSDMLAWGTQRQRLNHQGEFLMGIAVQIKKILPSSWLHVNETNAVEWCANVPV